MSQIDLSLPLATLLREGTKSAHETVESTAGAGFLLRGELEREEYARFLMMMWHIYDTFERALEIHASNAVLQPTYNPSLLARAPALSSDISHLLQVSESSWKSHPIHTTLLSSAPPAFTAYKARIQSLSDSATPLEAAPLIAHAYVRYLGDLSGGQMIRKRLAKAYGLDEEPGSAGLAFYDFNSLGGKGWAVSQGDMKKIKDWFRNGMNEGAGDDAKVKAAILREANTAFDLNTGLFATLRGPSETAKTKEIPVVIVQEGLEPLTEKAWPLSTVATLVAAVCLAHFLIVVGGFSGEKGYAKLVAVEAWLHNVWSSLKGSGEGPGEM